MKRTNTHSRLSLSAVLVGATLLTTSCQSTTVKKPKEPKAVAISSALTSGNWVKVRKSPPTYFPKGTPKDHATGMLDGHWILSGDTNDTRFFIPANATPRPRQELVAEARAAMTPEARDRQRKGNNSADFKVGAGQVACRTAYGIAQLLAAMGGAAP